MVDFNNETTVGTPAVDVVRILILQRRADCIEALEKYKKEDFAGITPNIALLKSRIYGLFLEIQGALKRKLEKNKEQYEQLIQKINSNNIKDIEEAFFYLNEYLDRINLTKIDNKKEYDRSSFEKDNKEQGLR